MSRQPGRGGGCRLRDRTLFFEIEMPCIIFISPIKQLLLRGRVLCLCLRFGVGHGEKFFYDRLIIHNPTQIGGFQFKFGVLVQNWGVYVLCGLCLLSAALNASAPLQSELCSCSPGGLVPLAPAVLCASSPLCVSTHRSGRRSRPCAARGTPRSRTCSPRAADATGCASPPPRRSAPPQSPPRAPSGRWRS